MNYADRVVAALAPVVQEDEVAREDEVVLAEVDLTEAVEDNHNKSSERKD